MAQRDTLAGQLLRELRENRGLSPEQMPYALHRAGFQPVSGPTVRRIEREGMVPHIATRFALAQFFGREVTDVWRPSRDRVAA